MLAAADLGRGTLWFTFFNPEDMRVCLGVPATLEVAGIIPVVKVKAPPRKDPKAHRESHGRTQWPTTKEACIPKPHQCNGFL